jgi:hypothetical protein
MTTNSNNNSKNNTNNTNNHTEGVPPVSLISIMQDNVSPFLDKLSQTNMQSSLHQSGYGLSMKNKLTQGDLAAIIKDALDIISDDDLWEDGNKALNLDDIVKNLGFPCSSFYKQ